MIHSARPTVPPVANIALVWDLFSFEKVGTDGHVRTDGLHCKNNDHYRPWLWVSLVDQNAATAGHFYVIENLTNEVNIL